MGVRRSIDEYLDMIGHDYGGELIEPPDLLIDELAASGVPAVDPSDFSVSLENLAPRRRSLYQLVVAEGFTPNYVSTMTTKDATITSSLEAPVTQRRAT